MAAMEGGGSEPRRVIARRYEDLGFIDGSWIMGYRLWFMSYWLWFMGYGSRVGTLGYGFRV
jgi:hypothetical protein